MQDIKSYAIRCFQDEAQAILDLIPRLDDNFTKAVEMIFNCKGKVIVTGVGKSGHVGEKMASTLASLGTPSFFLNPLDASGVRESEAHSMLPHPQFSVVWKQLVIACQR